MFGRMFSATLLLATHIVGLYFAKGDTKIFETIRFSLQTPIAEDTPIIRFIKHAEQQKLASWGFSNGLGGSL